MKHIISCTVKVTWETELVYTWKALRPLYWATSLPFSSYTLPFPYSPHHNTGLYFNQRQHKFQQVLGWPTLEKVPYTIHIIYVNQLPWLPWISGNKASVLYTVCLFWYIPIQSSALFFSLLLVLELTCMHPLWQLSGLQTGGIWFESWPEIGIVFCLPRWNWR